MVKKRIKKRMINQQFHLSQLLRRRKSTPQIVINNNYFSRRVNDKPRPPYYVQSRSEEPPIKEIGVTQPVTQPAATQTSTSQTQPAATQTSTSQPATQPAATQTAQPATSSNYNNMSVPELKNILKERKMLISGSRADLINTLYLDDQETSQNKRNYRKLKVDALRKIIMDEHNIDASTWNREELVNFFY